MEALPLGLRGLNPSLNVLPYTKLEAIALDLFDLSRAAFLDAGNPSLIRALSPLTGER